MKAPQLELRCVDGKRYSAIAARGDNGLLVMFICNHCPYVKGAIDRIVRDCKELAPLGIGSIAVMSNDPADYPEDSFDNMKRVARAKGFPFPYVIDETQETSRAYGAQCTPDFFGFNAALELQYRGRLDSAAKGPAVAGTKRELVEETGYRARAWKKVAEFYTAPGFCTELMRVYVARGLSPARADGDADEIIRPVRVPLRKALDLVRLGKVRDAKSSVGLLVYGHGHRG
jgi:peroxiredoxin